MYDSIVWLCELWDVMPSWDTKVVLILGVGCLFVWVFNFLWIILIWIIRAIVADVKKGIE
jgi:hypothetical protein